MDSSDETSVAEPSEDGDSSASDAASPASFEGLGPEQKAKITKFLTKDLPRKVLRTMTEHSLETTQEEYSGDAISFLMMKVGGVIEADHVTQAIEFVSRDSQATIAMQQEQMKMVNDHNRALLDMEKAQRDRNWGLTNKLSNFVLCGLVALILAFSLIYYRDPKTALELAGSAWHAIGTLGLGAMLASGGAKLMRKTFAPNELVTDEGVTPGGLKPENQNPALPPAQGA